MTGDKKILEVLLPTLEAIISCYIMGTKHNIHIDQNDGLLYVGEQGLAMTWMDATINENPVTPRTGKPVCLSALWYSALIIMSEFLKSVERPAQKYLSEAEKTKIGFDKFWNETTGYCYDVIEGTDGNDSSLRPNQIFAVSLPFSPLPLERQKKVVDICSKNLLTSFGLRTLAPNDQRYRGVYAGNLTERDLTYHNGTAWGWLLGPFVIAHFKVYHDSELALSYLEPMKQMLSAYGIGTLGELFDGDPPFTPRGCIAQAWTVAEVIRAYTYIINNIDTKAKKGTRNAA
jgi:predicted glycogen debranching enzyme